MAHKGQTGTSTTLVKTASRQKREKARREREEKRWAAKCGPVKTYFDPSIMR